MRPTEITEYWKEISGFPYQVSTSGKVRRHKITSKFSNSFIGKILKPWKKPGGYLAVTLVKGGKQYAFTVHRLVAEAFMNKKPGDTDVHHIDGNKHNNSFYNLAYCTRGEHITTYERVGPRPKLSKKEHEEILSLSTRFTGRELALKYNCCPATISGIVNKGRKYMLNGD